MCKNQKMIERNYSIDILKFICAILVVFLHTDCVYHATHTLRSALLFYD